MYSVTRVLACICELPVMLLLDLPRLLQKRHILRFSEYRDQSMTCLRNVTQSKNDRHSDSRTDNYINNKQLERERNSEEYYFSFSFYFV